jgi:hypothetical protein
MSESIQIEGQDLPPEKKCLDKACYDAGSRKDNKPCELLFAPSSLPYSL